MSILLSSFPERFGKIDVMNNLQRSFTRLTKLNLGKNLGEIFSNPMTIIALLGLAILLTVFIVIKKIKFSPSLITKIALMVALAVVLDYFKIHRLAQGGSITFGSMVPILLLALWFGPEIGLLGGMLFGFISLLLGPFIVHPVQVLFDYPLPYLMLGIAGYFRYNKYLAVVIAVLLRYVCHVISGVVFFAEYAGDIPVLQYSLVYNGTYLIPELIICVIILALLPTERLYKAITKAA
jgi:thiamine transporter